MHPLKTTALHQDWQTLYTHLTATGKPIDNETAMQLLYLRGFRDLEFFANYFFRDWCEKPFSQMHRDFFTNARHPERRGVREVIAAPRGHAKTTFKVLLKALHAIVYDLEPFIVIIGRTKPDAEDRLIQIREQLESNTRLNDVFGSMIASGGKKTYKSRQKLLTTNGVHIRAASRGQSLRGLNQNGQRPSLIILDDIESLEEVRNPDQRKKTRNWFMRDILKLGQLQGKTNMTVVGTCLHPESLISELLENPGWQGSLYRAIISYAHNSELWQHYRQILVDLANPLRQEEAHQFYLANEGAMLEGASVLWPDGEPYEYLIRLRIEEGDAAFNAEKQNEPYDPDLQLFDMKNARRFQPVYDKGIFAGVFITDTQKYVQKFEIERIIAYHDPAYSEAPTSKSDPDYAAIVVVAKDVRGYLYVLDAFVEKVPPNAQIAAGIGLLRKWNLETLYYENNGSQALLGPLYKAALEKEGINAVTKLTGVHQSENKYERISTLQPDIANGHLLFSAELSKRFMDQMTQFPTATHEDGPDALHGAVRKLKRAGGTITMIQEGRLIR